MKLEELFASIDLSVELQIAGLGDNSLFTYYSDEKQNIIIAETDCNRDNHIAPAFTTDEIMAALPVTLDLGDNFYIGSNKFEPEINEYDYRINDRDVLLTLEKTSDSTLFRYIASYIYPGKSGRIGLPKADDGYSVLYGHGFYPPTAAGRLYLLLNEKGIINK